MLDELETLAALRDLGTTGKAAARLRITQSAVSKRLSALADLVGAPLVERRGRRVELTPRAVRLLGRLDPLLADLRSALADEDRAAHGAVVVGVSESVLASWGAGVLSRAAAAVPALAVELHAHRSPAVVERVAAGEYELALIAGHGDDGRGLAAEELLREPMALIGAGRKGADLPLLTIEERSGTWLAIERRALRLGLAPAQRLESFFAVAQLAVAGFGRGLVPVGVAESLALGGAKVQVFGREQLSRPISLVARRRTLARVAVGAFVAALRVECAALGARWR